MIRISMEGGVIVGICTDNSAVEQEDVYLVDYDVELAYGHTTTPYGDDAYVGKLSPICKDEWTQEDLERMCQEQRRAENEKKIQRNNSRRRTALRRS